MTTIVYTEEVMTTTSPNSSPRNIQKFTVQIMEDDKNGGRQPRSGSPKPQKRFSVVRHMRKSEHKSSKSFEVQSVFPSNYNPHMFTITAYLPYDGGRRLKVNYCSHCRKLDKGWPYVCVCTQSRSWANPPFMHAK